MEPSIESVLIIWIGLLIAELIIDISLNLFTMSFWFCGGEGMIGVWTAATRIGKYTDCDVGHMDIRIYLYFLILIGLCFELIVMFMIDIQYYMGHLLISNRIPHNSLIYSSYMAEMSPIRSRYSPGI